MITYRAVRHHYDHSAPETFEHDCLADALDNAKRMCGLSGVAYVTIFRGDVELASRVGRIAYDESTPNTCGA